MNYFVTNATDLVDNRVARSLRSDDLIMTRSQSVLEP